MKGGSRTYQNECKMEDKSQSSRKWKMEVSTENGGWKREWRMDSKKGGYKG